MRKKKFKYKKNKKIRLIQKNSVKKRWVTKKKTFSSFPYVITISHYRRNIFFTAANLKGQTKLWISSGRCGFHGRNKINKMAVFTVANAFFKKVASYGIKYAIFKYKNYNKNRWQIQKVIKKLRRLKILGFLIETQIPFNGCRTKKKKENRFFRVSFNEKIFLEYAHSYVNP